jgi:hypothetical protein
VGTVQLIGSRRHAGKAGGGFKGSKGTERWQAPHRM